MTPTHHLQRVAGLISGPERISRMLSRSWSPETLFAIWFFCLMVALAGGVLALAR